MTVGLPALLSSHLSQDEEIIIAHFLFAFFADVLFFVLNFFLVLCVL